MHATPIRLGPLDRLSPSARHLLLAAVPLVLGYLTTYVVPALEGHPTLAAALVLLLQVAALWTTPATRQYGAGSKDVAGGELPTDETPELEPGPGAD